MNDLGTAIGINRVAGSNGLGFSTEADWGIYRGLGFGNADPGDGWLVTFVMGPSGGSGSLVAYEIAGNRKTGRCLLLTAAAHGFGPSLPMADADELLDEARAQPWFQVGLHAEPLNVETKLLPWL